MRGWPHGRRSNPRKRSETVCLKPNGPSFPNPDASPVPDPIEWRVLAVWKPAAERGGHGIAPDVPANETFTAVSHQRLPIPQNEALCGHPGQKVCSRFGSALEMVRILLT
jgi:hypothetical protein